MKKLLPVLMIICLLFSGCGEAGPISYAGITEITVASFKYESFPYQKVVDKTEDIEKLIGFINDAEKDKVSKKKVDDWKMTLSVTGEHNHSIKISDKYMVIDGKWHEISEKTLFDIQYIYHNLEYYEVDYVKPQEK